MDYEGFKASFREDEVKMHVLEELGIELDMRYSIDCYTENVLFEFKYKKDVKRPDVLAQSVYYLNTLYKHGERMPAFIALMNEEELIVFQVELLKDFYKDDSFFASGHPSEPANSAIQKAKQFINDIYFYILIENSDDYAIAINSLKDLLRTKRIIKDRIKLSNVRRAYRGYVRQLGEYILSSSTSKGVFEFRADAIGKATVIRETTLGDYVIDFQFANGAKRFENIDKHAYDSYWRQWKRIENEAEAINVFKTIYDLLGISDRRTKGQFYTPKDLANIAWNRIKSQLGERFFENGNWRIWDCCAGTGNLEYGIIPEEALQYLYLSTLDIEEVDQLNDKFPLAKKVFQFDFLNDHNNQLPEELKNDMANPNIKWLFIINPPYLESQGATNIASGSTESNVQVMMKYHNLGDAGRELFAQFLFRIEYDFKNKYFLGLFSSTKFIVSKKFESFRKFWSPIFRGGFVCNASEHFQCSGNWPLIFSLFDRTNTVDIFDNETNWGTNDLKYDIFDKNSNIVGEKKFNVYDKNNNFRKYFTIADSLKTVKYPLLKSAISLSNGKQYASPYGPRDLMGCLIFIGADFQQQNRSFIVSGIANTNCNNILITPDNYLNVLSGFGLYKAPSISWLNNKDRFKLPCRPLTEEEIYDAILYALVCDSNQTATYKLEDGSIIINKLNPLDSNLFDFSKCSALGKEVFNLLSNYLVNEVKYNQINTLFGTGKFLGLYQYKKDANFSQCYGYKFSDNLKNKIEDLRKRLESLAIEVCF